jgi:hypothetical protein
MAERNTSKSKRSEAAKGTAAPKSMAPPKADEGGAAEVAGLKAELATARARIAELEQKQADIINRIDWVIDSLHNLTE